jgi:hypothetical protein
LVLSKVEGSSEKRSRDVVERENPHIGEKTIEGNQPKTNSKRCKVFEINLFNFPFFNG